MIVQLNERWRAVDYGLRWALQSLGPRAESDLARHPELERLPASAPVARIVARTAREHSAWFWRGGGPVARRPGLAG
jgi:hypothetical protein